MRARGEGRGPRGAPWPGPWGTMAGEGARSHLYLLAGDLSGAGGPGRGVQVARAQYVLQQVD